MAETQNPILTTAKQGSFQGVGKRSFLNMACPGRATHLTGFMRQFGPAFSCCVFCCYRENQHFFDFNIVSVAFQSACVKVQSRKQRKEKMAQLLITLPDSSFVKLATAAMESDQSIDEFLDFLISQSMFSTAAPEEDNAGKALDEALKNIAELNKDEVFELTEVISAETWELLGNGEKKSLGKRFKKVSELPGAVFEYLDTKTNRHAIYKVL